jgi:hypothetical protein
MQTKMSESDYRKAEGISQSFLKQVLKNDFTPPNGTNVGSLVDSLVYNGNTEGFYVGEKIPTKVLNCFKRVPNDTPFKIEAHLAEIRKEEYYPNWSDAKHRQNLHELYPFYLEAEGKIIVTKEEMLQAKEIALNMESDRIWLENKEGDYQVPLFGEYDDVKIKGLLDQLYRGWDLTIKDLKVTDCKLSDWMQFVAKPLKYPFQASYYQELVFQNYAVVPEFNWLVYSTVDKKMMKVVASENDLKVGKYGNNYTKGWIEAIQIYKKCKNEVDFFLPFYEGNGVITSSIY